MARPLQPCEAAPVGLVDRDRRRQAKLARRPHVLRAIVARLPRRADAADEHDMAVAGERCRVEAEFLLAVALFEQSVLRHACGIFFSVRDIGSCIRSKLT